MEEQIVRVGVGDGDDGGEGGEAAQAGADRGAEVVGVFGGEVWEDEGFFEDSDGGELRGGKGGWCLGRGFWGEEGEG